MKKPLEKKHLFECDQTITPLPSLPRIENPALFQPTRLKKALQEKILMFEGYLNDPDKYHVEQLEGYEEMLVHLRYLDRIVELEDTF